jgi:hypothetical protein
VPSSITLLLEPRAGFSINQQKELLVLGDKFPWKKPENLLDFDVVSKALDPLVLSIENQVDRRWPERLGGTRGLHLPFVWMVKTARWTHTATRYLLADKPPDHRRKLEFAIAAHPLNRTILDMVFNAVYIFDDYPRRLCSYVLAGLKQHREADQLYVERFSSDPEWTAWLSDLKGTWPNQDAIRDGVRAWCPDAEPYFPHPGKIIKSKSWKDPEALKFLKYLDAQYYRGLSSSAHGQWMGLARMAAQAIRIESREQDQEEFALKEKSDLLIQQVAFVLCLVSEFLAHAQLEGEQEAKYLWTLLSSYSGWVKELYSMRYREALSR